MTRIDESLDQLLDSQRRSGKPLAVVLAGHNGSGKSTMWYEHLAPELQMPLVNADRMMMSILPSVRDPTGLPEWASKLRDENTSWMIVAQEGVKAFVANAMLQRVPFAMETVFSHWKELPGGSVESKIGLIEDMKTSGYFVLLLFVGLTSSALSIARVSTRVAAGGHAVPERKLLDRFPRTQKAIAQAVTVADLSILVDNSRDLKKAFTVCRVQKGEQILYDRRTASQATPLEIRTWLDTICPDSES